jgi:hypothetical protein
MTDIKERIEELEAKRDYAWRLFQYYCEKLDELRRPPEEPGTAGEDRQRWP